MIDLSPYPNNVGKILNPEPNLFELDKKTIIRISGLAGAGKGTLSKQLVDFYELGNLETSYILRSATWIYLQSKLEFNKENTDIVFDQIEIKYIDKQLKFVWNKADESEISLSDIELRSNQVQAKVSIFSGDPYFRIKYYNKINYILNNLIDSAVILDGRGFNTPYLNQAKKDGFKVIEIFLWSSEISNYNRYKSAYIQRNKILNWNNQDESNCKLEFLTNISDRNIQDYKNSLVNDLGALTHNAGIIDTSNLTPVQVLQIAVEFIQNNK
jgi:cytidylate kinase